MADACSASWPSRKNLSQNAHPVALLDVVLHHLPITYPLSVSRFNKWKSQIFGETDILSNDIDPDIQKAIEMDIDKGLNRIRSCVNGHVSDTGQSTSRVADQQLSFANQRATGVETSMTNSQALPANGVGLPPCINEAYQSIHFAPFDGTTQVQVVVELD